jgi:hypothetical protein
LHHGDHWSRHVLVNLRGDDPYLDRMQDVKRRDDQWMVVTMKKRRDDQWMVDWMDVKNYRWPNFLAAFDHPFSNSSI